MTRTTARVSCTSELFKILMFLLKKKPSHLHAALCACACVCVCVAGALLSLKGRGRPRVRPPPVSRTVQLLLDLSIHILID